MWIRTKQKSDSRSRRLIFLIECLLNQNARDRGAAERTAVTREVVDTLSDAEIGMVQIPCPEIACLGFDRTREPGSTIRQALEAAKAIDCCHQLAVATADKIQCYVDEGFEVLAVLGGNEESPGCAVHVSASQETRLTDRSGVFMRELEAELSRRDLQIEFRGMRDANSGLLHEDLKWLRDCIS
jgi:predicted secreted protein